ncbi:DUF4326 domain-containing protein [Oceaniglobus indicus]|uniref:DUF4326 domain-containing protein n=1 Tax=Oceaniglobus indicus TaxID=2047749 RepID=UPI001F4E0F81|nr:DUF4326 domain-containing protein [Oceaniglobus indicus]
MSPDESEARARSRIESEDNPMMAMMSISLERNGDSRSMPKRIQMTRKKGGWRNDHPNAVIVARPTKWGNRFSLVETEGRRGAVSHFREWLMSSGNGWELQAMARTELRGRDLACWCPLDQPCHADVLLEIANAPIRTVED